MRAPPPRYGGRACARPSEVVRTDTHAKGIDEEGCAAIHIAFRNGDRVARRNPWLGGMHGRILHQEIFLDGNNRGLCSGFRLSVGDEVGQNFERHDRIHRSTAGELRIQRMFQAGYVIVVKRGKPVDVVLGGIAVFFGVGELAVTANDTLERILVPADVVCPDDKNIAAGRQVHSWWWCRKLSSNKTQEATGNIDVVLRKIRRRLPEKRLDSACSMSRSWASSVRPRKSNRYGSFRDSRARSDCGLGSRASKFVTALPYRSSRRVSI